MDWTGGYITVCFFPIWQVSFFDGCDGVEMWIWEVWFFFSPTSRVEEWEFGKMAEMIRMWGNQNEWCVKFANACVIGINNDSNFFFF